MQKRSYTMGDERRVFIEKLISDKESELIAFLVRRLPSRADAADAFQEIFLRMCRVEDPERIENPPAFLFRTAANIVQDFYRRRMRRENLTDQMPEQEHYVSEQPSPARALFAKEWWSAYCKAVNELPPKCRRVFVMCRMQNLSHSEIASELGISIKMVEKYMTKALLHLHKELEEYLAGDFD